MFTLFNKNAILKTMESNEILVLYETFTGTCMAYAEILARFLSCEKKKLSEFNGTVAARAIIILSPVHAQSIPKKVLNKLKTCNLKGQQVIPVVVYGGINSGAALCILARLLRKSGGKIIGAAECISEHSYSILTGLIKNTPTANDTEMIQFCEFVKTAIFQETPLEIKSFRGYSNLFSHLPKRMLAALSVRLPVIEKHEKCTDCGLCVSECPVAAIDTQKSIIKAKCVRCLHCARVCPSKARRAKFSQPFIRRYLSKKRNCKNRYYLSLPI